VVWQVKARLPDGRVRYKIIVDHTNQSSHCMRVEVDGGCFKPDWSYDSAMVSGQRHLREQASLNDLIEHFIRI